MGFKRHNEPPPRDMIGPRVVCLSRLMRQAFNEAATEQGLFAGQEEIVLALVENEGITLSALAKKLEVSPATASVSIKRMEKAGFINKKPDKNDARIIRLYPTDKAKAAPMKIKDKMDSLEAILSKDMTKEETLQLTGILDRAIKNMLERGEGNA